VAWTKTPLPDNAEAQYNFTSFAMTLNEVEPRQATAAAPTDCRFRPDQVTHRWRDVYIHVCPYVCICMWVWVSHLTADARVYSGTGVAAHV
jgi:hypothetical protein